MTSLRILYWKYCNICGNTHSTENCPFLQNVEIIRDTFTLSRARLSLPKGLEVIDFVDGTTSVIARSQFKRGVQFGPMIARKTPDFDVTSNFPIKIFSEDIPSEKNDDWQYLDTSNEHLCNWMCLVAPATCLEEQNIICFQMKREVFFLLVRDVEPGEQLRVWYAPQYGVEMLAKQLQSSLTNEEVLPVHVEEPAVPTTEYLSSREKKRKRKQAKSKLIAQSINYSPELRDRLASKLPSAILGAKNPKSEWDCAKCGFKSNLLTEYAKHLMTHREALEQYKCCSCEKVLATRKAQKYHSKICKKARTENAETENPKISPSVDEMNKADIGRNKDHIMTEYDKQELDQSDMSTVLDSLTDSTPMKKLLLTDSSVLPCSEKDSPFPKEYEIFLDSLTDFRSNSSNTISDSNLLSKINLKNDQNNVDSFTDAKNQETNDIRDDGLSVAAQPHKEMESDNPPILDLGDEIVFQNIKSFADIENEVAKNTDFSNEMAFDSNHTEQGHSQTNHIPSLTTSEKSSKTDQNVDPNDLDLDLLCEVTLDVTGVHNDRLVDNLINESEERLNNSEIDCAAAQLNKNATATPSASGGEKQSEFLMKLDNNPFEAIELTLDSGNPAEKIVHDKKIRNLNKIYSCEICNKKFSEPSYLLRHLKSHTGEFTCVMCLRVFARKESLENHICSDVSVFRCKLCNCVFKTKRDLKNHLKQHINEKKPTDKETWSKLSVRKVLDRSHALLSPDSTEINNKIHDLETSQLPDCKEDSVEFSKKEYVCELCGAHYKSSRALSYHRLTHDSNKGLTCYICDKKFHRKSVLDNHISCTHLNLKKSCPICKMLLTGEKSLRSHIKRHTVQQQKFKCHACDKTFLHKFSLSKHMRIKHQGNEKPDNGQESAQNTARVQLETLKSSDNQPPQRRNKTGNRRKKSQYKNEEYICRYCHTILNNRNSVNRHLRVKHQDCRKEWSVPEVVDSMRVVIEEAAAISTAVPVTHQVDIEPILADVETDENMVVTNDPVATDIQPSTSDTAENTSDPIANQLCPLDYAFTLKTVNNQESDVIGYQPLMQPLNAAELFQLEGNDNTPALILDDSSVVQSGIQLDKELFYLVFTSEPETQIPN